MRILFRVGLAALTACGAAGTGTGNGGITSPPPAPDPIVGTYQLGTAASAPLPQDLYGVYNGPNGTSITRMVAASLVVGAGGTYTSTATTAVWNGTAYGPASYSVSQGAVAKSGANYVFTGGVLAGTGMLTGNSLSVVATGVTYSYLK